jgi:transposase
LDITVIYEIKVNKRQKTLMNLHNIIKQLIGDMLMMNLGNILDIIIGLPKEVAKKFKELISKDESEEKECTSVPAGTPFVAIELLEKLGVPAIIDDLLGEEHTSLELLKRNRDKEEDEQILPSTGVVLSILIADMIARSKKITRIYKVEDISSHWKLFELFGINPQKLNDDRILRALSKLGSDSDGMNGIILKLTLKVCEVYGVPLESILLDSTVVPLDGEFNDASKVTVGRGSESSSQLITSLIVAAKSKIPIGGFVYPGNTNDATTLPDAINVINNVVSEVNKNGNIELIMDRIYITAKNVLMMRANEKVKINWLGPLKSGLSEVKFREKINQAYEQDLWKKISYRSPKETAKNEEPTLEAFETIWVMSEEIKPELEAGQKRRAKGSIKRIEANVRCVVYKDAKKACSDKKNRDEKRKKLDVVLKEFSSKINKRKLKTIDACDEALNKILKKYSGFEKFLECSLNSKEEKGIINLKWEWNESNYKEEEKYDGLFALLTEYSQEEKDGNTLIGLYRGRNEIEMNFRDLKGILDLERLFIREPERIDAYIFLKIIAYFVLAFLRWYALEKCNVKTTESKVQDALGDINIIESEFSDSNITFCGITGDNRLCRLFREEFGLPSPYKSINVMNNVSVSRIIDWLSKTYNQLTDKNSPDIIENSV